MQGEHPAEGVTRVHLLAVARGFSCVFWGIGLGILLLTGFLTIRMFNRLALSPHILGVLVVLAGALRLSRANLPVAGWTARSRLLVGAALLQIYLVPFLTWWRQMPGVKLFAANVFILLLATLWLLSLSSKLVADVGAALGDRVLRAEARLCELSAAVFILGPAFCVLFVTLLNSLRAEGGVTIRIPPVYVWPLWVHVFVAIPFLLTMAAAWEAKEACWRRMERQ
jgi:hypothetical protein